MLTRDKNFYDFVGRGLSSFGYEGNSFQAWIDEMFPNKYNADATFSQMGFPLNPDIPINPTYEQLEATIRPYTMAAYVDIDSDGPTKSTDGLLLKMGKLPTFKHEITLSRKTLREQMMLADKIGNITPEMEGIVMDLLFYGIDDLLGGNYNTFLYQRHQIVSNKGKLVINAENNPLGIPVEVDFGVPKKNIKTSTWYTKSDDTVTEDSGVSGGTVDPIKVMRDVRRNATEKDFAPAGHWECDQVTFDDLISLPYFRKMYATFMRPDITDGDQKLSYANLVDDAAIKTFIEGRIGAPITIIDSVSAVEKFDTATKKISYSNLRSFNEGVLVYVPDGALGDVQCGRPIYMDTPGSRVALYDGGRTLIRQVFNDENMIQTVKSEVTGLVVPNKTRWFYYLTIKGA